ncbi:MAG: iron ABC transporter permease [Neisseriaceae bacterium]|nr:iron ABC transporter permease [Neisseriaceae bacterium]MBR3424643.1 iron ABC transporter permease [Neisseriaceae bacterium]
MIKKISLMISLILLALLVIFVCAGVGLGSWQNPLALDDTLLALRLPRVFNALLVGLSLSVAGAALQALFENPLADPGLIGTSGGAALGVVLVLSLGFIGIGVPLAAFSGSLIVCVFVLLAHRLFGGGKAGLLIIGFIISSFCSAVVGLVLFLSDDFILRSAMTWLAGSLAQSGFVSPLYAASSMLLGLIILIPMGQHLDILLLGEETAVSMGIKVYPIRALAVAGAALLTGAAVSLSGMIGFVGMMIPNLMAVIFRGSRTKIMLLSAYAGALFLLITDTASRSVAYPVDFPVGIVIALIGAPFFVWLFAMSLKRSGV